MWVWTSGSNIKHVSICPSLHRWILRFFLMCLRAILHMFWFLSFQQLFSLSIVSPNTFPLCFVRFCFFFLLPLCVSVPSQRHVHPSIHYLHSSQPSQCEISWELLCEFIGRLNKEKINWFGLKGVKHVHLLHIFVFTHWELQRQGEGVVARERLGGPWRQTLQVCLQTDHQNLHLWLSSPEPHWTTWRWEREIKYRESEAEACKRRSSNGNVMKTEQKKINAKESESNEQSRESSLFLSLCSRTCLCKCVWFMCVLFTYVYAYLPLVFHTSSQFTLKSHRSQVVYW